MSNVPPVPPSSQTPPSVSEEFRSLRRSRSDRVVAGVLGGLGRRLGIDPVVLRVATVVLAIFGGVGVLLYAVAWLLVPAEGDDGSILDQALGRGERRNPGTTPLALLLAIVGLTAGIGIIAGSWDGGVLLFLAGAGLFVLLRRRDDDGDRAASASGDPPQAWVDAPGEAQYAPPGTVPVTGVAGHSSAGAAGAAGIQVHADASAGTGTDSAAGTGPADLTPPGTVPTTGWPEGPDWGPAAPVEPEPEQAPPARRKQRSALGPITVFAALVAVGVLAVNDVYWAEYPAAMYVAVPLGIVAVGLLVGAWYGRSRGLIALGILLALALVPAAWASQWDYGNVGDATFTYSTVAEVPTESQSHAAGTIHYDLSDLTLTDTSAPVRLGVEQGAGDLTITVPRDADVTVNASMGAGDLTMFGENRDGLGQEIRELVDEGPDGPGGGEIVLDLELGFGDLEVTR
ncbi:PspC domain-containing protein [Jiangella asiatica]|uniref:PspC domain-containing protein n=1 Tax=Jiangella asiatica TaxID=2530372 RepID=A0A4V2Z496_9ACTN|nr:PspC domain-containing protein [Jiangella asiatica]TDE15748.1 PspC domain-containing protein [Jiangella asiatica]